MLLYADERNYTMVAGSKGQGEKESGTGLISGHAYSLISIHQFEAYGEQVRLLKLRNPWGKFEWNGPWSDEYKYLCRQRPRQVLPLKFGLRLWSVVA